MKLIYSEKYQTLQQAMKREWQVKKWTKAKKEAVINGNLKLFINLIWPLWLYLTRFFEKITIAFNCNSSGKNYEKLLKYLYD